MKFLGNLLTEPVIGIADVQGLRLRLTLPQVLARLADAQASTVAFTALQAHQAHAWHAFLVQLAAMVCHRADDHAMPVDADGWAGALRGLGGGDASWTLVVDDLTLPAFHQPPVPEKTLTGFANQLATPGALDLLVTAKNHDRKLESSSPDDLAAWMFALISAQTGQGYSGKFNYGIMRMNGGLGNRPGVGLRSGLDLGAAFRRDVAILLNARASLLARGFFRDDGIALLWCTAWDGSKSISWQELNPWAIECCRRIRLQAGSTGLIAVMAPTKVPRITTPDEYTGDSGDPWTPIQTTSGKSLTLPGIGFTYQKAAELLLPSAWEQPAAQQVQADDQTDLRWYGRALVRGQGKTEGWHEREIPIDPKIHQRFLKRDEREKLAKTAKSMVELTGVMRLNILKPALLALWEDADGPIAAALLRLEHQVDVAFFPHLWDHPDQLDPWRAALAGWAKTILDVDAATIAPMADRWKRISAADSRFNFCLHHKQHPAYNVFLPLPISEVSVP